MSVNEKRIGDGDDDVCGDCRDVGYKIYQAMTPIQVNGCLL